MVFLQVLNIVDCIKQVEPTWTFLVSMPFKDLFSIVASLILNVCVTLLVLWKSFPRHGTSIEGKRSIQEVHLVTRVDLGSDHFS